ncbi:MAG: hypothetical protein ACP5PT_09200, partial [Brevinematia bacterium]
LSVPDPRVTNPELFDLTKPDAPIPQFVKALENAGIGITAEQVVEGVEFQTITSQDGNPFVVGVYNLDPSLFPKQYQSLAGPIPLFIAQRNEKGEWGWEKITESLRMLTDSLNFLFGSQIVYYKLNDPIYRQIAAGNFNIFLSDGEAREPQYWVKPQGENNYDFNYTNLDKIISLARRTQTPLLVNHLVEPSPSGNFVLDSWPDWA